MAKWIYVPITEATLVQMANDLQSFTAAKVVIPTDQGTAKAFRRTFGTGLLQSAQPFDTIYVLTHGTGDEHTVSTLALGQRPTTDKERNAAPRIGLGDVADQHKVRLVYYRCGGCTRVDRYPGPCESCGQPTAPWTQAAKLYRHHPCGRTQTTPGDCVVCANAPCPRVPGTTRKQCLTRGCCGRGKPDGGAGIDFKVEEVTAETLAVFFKAYSPARLARALEKEGLSKLATDVRSFSCGSGTSSALEKSYAERLWECLRAQGYERVSVIGYKGSVMVDKANRCVKIEVDVRGVKQRVPFNAREHQVIFPPPRA